MQIPRELQDGLRRLLQSVPEQELRRASRKLTEAYKGECGSAAMQSRTERIAYMAVRLPATYAAVRAVLEETAARIPGFAPRTVLDVGAGPGTALFAALEIFPSITKVVAVERSGELAQLGRELADGFERGAEWRWQLADIRSWKTSEKFDLVIASYSLGELSLQERRSAIERAWQTCRGAMAIVEPGTRRGFDVIAAARSQLVEMNGSLAAPCPHALACPMQLAGDWCHFPARVERSAEHRRIKGGELGYEDEKFSYVVASIIPVAEARSRIVRHPMRYSGYTKLQLCTPAGIKEETVTRSQKEQWRKVKRADWGSGWQ